MKPPLIDFSEFSFDHVVADQVQIFNSNPHRYELALLDGILMIDEKRAVGYYDVPAEPFWARGHFPGRPMMPGVLIAEVAAQLTSYLATQNGIKGDAIIGLAGLNDIRFRAPVVPGDRLLVMAVVKKSRQGAMIVTDYQVYVRDTLASEGQIKGIPMGDDEL